MAQNTFICPFCGGLAKMIKNEHIRSAAQTEYKIKCEGCGTKSSSYSSRDKLVSDWYRLAKDCDEVIDVMGSIQNVKEED